MKRITRNKRLVTVIYAIAIMLVTTTAAIGVYDFNTKEGSLTIDDKKVELKTKKSTVSELLEEQKIKLKDEDSINVSMDEKLKDKFDIKIRKAMPISIKLKNNVVEVKTTEETVKDVLKSLAIYYDGDDIVTPALDEKIKPNTEISVVEVEEKIQTVAEEIDYKVVTNNNGNLDSGRTLKVQEGIKGLRENKIKEIYKDGSLISKEIVESNVVREPVDEVVQKGTKAIMVASRGGKSTAGGQSSNASLAGKRSIVMTATAYDLSFQSTGKNPGDKGYGLTASGTQVRPGVVAVDPKVIPLGTKLYIESMDGYPSYGYAVAEDTGGAIKGNKVDVFLQSGTKEFGRRQVKVYILD